jgi:hypothetical protein
MKVRKKIMRWIYSQNYAKTQMLRLSLDLLWAHASGVSVAPASEPTLPNVPAVLSVSNAPYVPIFINSADRALHHAANAWKCLADDLAEIHLQDYLFGGIKPDDRIQTNDQVLKYEIEAFFAATMAVTAEDLIGLGSSKKAHNRLGKSIPALGMPLVTELRRLAVDFHSLGMEKKWRDIRNSAYHLSPTMNSWAIKPHIEKRGGTFVVCLDNVYLIEGVHSNFVDTFQEVFEAFLKYVFQFRALITQWVFENASLPNHRRYSWHPSRLGNMYAAFGPQGHESRFFPDTAVDFMGPRYIPEEASERQKAGIRLEC